MKPLYLLMLMFYSGSALAQQQSVAVIVEEHSERFDFIFYCKLGLLLIIGIVAVSSYLKFHKQEKTSK